MVRCNWALLDYNVKDCKFIFAIPRVEWTFWATNPICHSSRATINKDCKRKQRWVLPKHLQTNNEGSVGKLYPYNRTHLVEIENAHSTMLVYASSSSTMRNDVWMQREAFEELSTMFREPLQDVKQAWNSTQRHRESYLSGGLIGSNDLVTETRKSKEHV